MSHATRGSRTPSTESDQRHAAAPKRWFRDEYCDAIWESEDLTAAEKAIAETYARHARNARGEKSPDADLAWVVYDRLMVKAGIRRRANVSTAVANLVKLGWLDPVEQVGRRPTLYRLTIPLGSSDGGTTEDAAGSSGVGTSVVPLSGVGSSTQSDLPKPRSSGGGTQPLLRPQGLTPTSLPTRQTARGDGRRGRELGESFNQKPRTGATWQQAKDLATRHAPQVIGVERERLVAAIHGAIGRSWSPSAIGTELARPAVGVDSVAAVLISRMKKLDEPVPGAPVVIDTDRRERLKQALRVTAISEDPCPHGARGGNVALPDGHMNCAHCRQVGAASVGRDIRDLPDLLATFLRELDERGLGAESDAMRDRSTLSEAQLDALMDAEDRMTKVQRVRRG